MESKGSMPLLTRFFPELNSSQIEKFQILKEAYADWNLKINVISRKDIDNIEEHHFLHSVSIAKLIQFLPNSKVLDLGAGGGFPCVPLAVMFPEVEFFAVDSIKKKLTVINEVCAAAQIKNVQTNWMRAEDFAQKVDFVVTRAVTTADKLEQWTKGKFKKENIHPLKNGILALKGGDLEEELLGVNGTFVIINLYDFFPLPYFETKKIVYIYK